MKNFTVVGRAQTSALFSHGEGLKFTINFDGRLVDFKIANRIQTEIAGEIEVGLFVESSGYAIDIEDAATFFSNRSNTLLNILSLAANAWIGNFSCEIVFETTPSLDDRAFFQCLLPHAPQISTPHRRIETGPALALIMALTTSTESARLLRSAVHYSEMLGRWCLEERLRCVTHAFVAVEALGKVALRQELIRQSVSEEKLAATLNINVKERNWRDQLSGVIRKKVIFHNDVEVYREAKRISDAYEHSTANFDELRLGAEEVVIKTAANVRQAILELCGISRHAS